MVWEKVRPMFGLIFKYIFPTFNASLICEIYYCNTETTSQRTVNWRMFSHSPWQSVQLKTDNADSLVSPPSPPLRPPWRPPAGGGHLARCRWGLRGHDGGSRGHPGERGWYDGWNLVNKIFQESRGETYILLAFEGGRRRSSVSWSPASWRQRAGWRPWRRGTTSCRQSGPTSSQRWPSWSRRNRIYSKKCPMNKMKLLSM